jgi:hypothetical protein
MKDLPPAPRDKKALFLSPEVYEHLRKAAEKVVVPDQKDFIVTRRGKETHFRLRPGFPTSSVSEPSCFPFFKTYTKPAEGEGDPIDVLTGGIVTGGATNTTVEDIELELLTLANEPKPNGTRLFLVVNFTAVTADDVLMPGVLSLGDITTEYVSPNMNPPDNKIPKNLDPDGIVYINLGEIRDGRFVAAKCGDKTIYHCPGSISHAP